jgi:hypothetical protein
MTTTITKTVTDWAAWASTVEDEIFAESEKAKEIVALSAVQRVDEACIDSSPEDLIDVEFSDQEMEALRGSDEEFA